MPKVDLAAALRTIEALADSGGIGPVITATEAAAEGKKLSEIAASELSDDLLVGTLAIKAAIGDLNSLVHAAGMIAAIRPVLEPEERIESLSLGAGATGQPDLVTDLRVAEFKFNQWRGNDGGRKKALLPDVIRLAHDTSGKRRYLYLLDADGPLHWLTTTTSKLATILEGTRHRTLLPELAERYGPDTAVPEFWHAVRDTIEVVSLPEVSPLFGGDLPDIGD